MGNIKIFVSYRHQNAEWVKEGGKYNLIPWLKEQLASEGVVFWTDSILRENHVGEDFAKKIKENILNADIALLLISQEFTASTFILEKELPWIKNEFDNGRIKIIPLLIEPLGRNGKKKISWIFDLQTIPNDITPLNSYAENDVVNWKKIRVEILDAISDKAEQLRNIPEKEKTLVEQPPNVMPPKLPEENIGESAKKDIAWYQKAAQQGDAFAQCNLGVMYEYGQGVAQNYAKAAEWYEKAAQQGFAKAQHNLGLMYDNGQGVAQNYAKAFAWYQKAAQQGFAKARHNLGLMYDNGQGVAQNYVKAVVWYQKAAQQGYAAAQNNLGLMYDNGQGVAQNYAKAREWYEKAAQQGYTDAQKQLNNLKAKGY